MKIQILAGVYGHNENGHVRPVRPGDPPIKVDGKIGARLVKAGVAAEIVEEIPKEATIVDADGNELDSESAEFKFPEYNENMTRQQLEEICDEMGLDMEEVKKAKNKVAVIELLDEAKAEYEAEGDAPDLDPAEAIK